MHIVRYDLFENGWAETHLCYGHVIEQFVQA